MANSSALHPYSASRRRSSQRAATFQSRLLRLALACTGAALAGLISAAALAQVQIGADIDGEANNDRFGWSVALSGDGSRMAAGARWNDGTGTRAGHVRVYDWNGGAWVQAGTDIDGEATQDRSGYSVALSADGNRLAIGARLNDGTASNAGHARIYQWNGAAWVQLGADIDGEAGGDNSGFSVALSADGNRVAVGARSNDGTASNAGHTRVYHWNGAAWVQLGADIDGEAAEDRFGYSVALSTDGSRLAVGARFNDGTGTRAGHVRVYDWNGAAWVQAGGDIDGEAAQDRSGYSVSLSDDGNRLAVGARYNDGAGNNAGHTRVYDWDGAAWLQAGSDIDGEAAGDEAGGSVALSSDGNRLAVGARHNDGNGGNAGHTRIYAWNGASTSWVQLENDIDGEAGGDRSGDAVAMADDGLTVAIGAPRNDGTAGDAGHVRAYALSPAPGFSAAFAPGTISLAGITTVSTVTFTVDNSAAAVAAANLDFSLDLPAGLLVATPSNAVTTCTSGTLTAVAGGTSISYSGGSAAAGGSCSVSADVTGTVGGNFLSTTGDLNSDLGSSGTASASLTVDAPPVIALLGGDPVNLFVGDTYAEPGATVSDDIDAPPAGVVVSGTVDTGTAGSYTLFYDAIDSAGNAAAQLTRTVNVADLPVISAGITTRSGGGGSLRVTSRDAGCSFADVRVVDAASQIPRPPANLDFPFGLVEFTVTGCAPGTVITVDLDHGQVLPDNLSAWKSGPWRLLSGANISGSTLTYTVTDGGPRDSDGVVNGVILDPVGLAVNRSPQQVPALPLPLLVLLAMITGALGARRARR